MKKIILGLFLILGVVSFAAPKFIDMTKVKNAGFDIVQDEEGLFTIASSNEESALVISYYLTEKNSKELSDTIKADAPNDVKFLASLDNDQAYVNEFKHVDFYSFTIVPKKQKINKYHIYVTYMSPKKLSKEDINKVIDATLNEAEGLIK